jgi:glycerol kinase
MPYILALDQGTTSCRAILFDEQGKARASAQRDFRQVYPRPGWVEHDADEIWSVQIAVAEAALQQAGAAPGEIAAIGITNQRETTVLWDRRSGAPLGRAIVWQDRRTADLCERLKAGGAEQMVRRKTGLLLDPYFSATKLAWMLEHTPGARERAQAGELAFGTIDSWLAWKLTGGAAHVTDASNAARTLLLDIHTGSWDGELLDLFRIPAAVLPEVRGSSEVCGVVSADGALRGVPIAGVAGDQQAALFGQACLRPGLAKNTYGTGCFALMNTGERALLSRHNLLTTVAWRLGQRLDYAIEGSVFIGGAVVQWLRDELGLIRTAAEIEPLAASVPDAAGVQFVPAFAGLGAPHWDAYARGALLGLTRGTRPAHIARAALEAIAQQVADVVEVMAADTGIALRELRVDGGAAVNDLLMQFQADLLGVPLVRPEVTETTALGAAYLAGLAVGVWKSTDDIQANWREQRRFEPRMDDGRRAELRQQWRKAVERAKGWEKV